MISLTQVMNFPTWKWEDINMDFVVGLPSTQRQNNSIWVVVDRLMKSSHIIAVKSTYLLEEYAKFYLDEIVIFHHIPLSIISDIGAQKGLGTQLMLNTAFHPQIVGQAEHTIQTLEDMLRSCVMDFK